MNEAIAWMAVFLSVALPAFFLTAMLHSWIFRYRLVVDARLGSLAGTSDSGKSVSLFKELGTNREQQTNLVAAIGEWLHHQIEQAGLQCSRKSFLIRTAAIGSASGIGVMFVAPWASIPAAAAGSMVPLGIVYAKRHARKRKMTRQLPEVFQIISRAVRSGQTVPAALRMIAEDYQSPVKEEFALCYEHQDLGMSRDLALRKLAERTQIMELQIFVVALLVQTRSGGDLVELLDNLALIVEKRMRLKNRIRALTGEGRMQATVLTVLPFVAFAAISFFSPDYAAVLLDKPYLLGATALSQLVGIMWISRIINFEY